MLTPTALLWTRIGAGVFLLLIGSPRLVEALRA
jgi:hypothetical protein